jgi:predicted transposase/invertase (TIGR01784 family)
MPVEDPEPAEDPEPVERVERAERTKGAERPSRDSLHHDAFSELRVARSLFENYLPASLADQCDWATLSNETPVYKKCFDSDAFCDLLFAVRFQHDSKQRKSQPLFLNLLFEHQSRPDPLMPFRLLRYMVRIWERYLVDHPTARRLPPVYPIVLHQSRRRWKAPTRLHQLFTIPGCDSSSPTWLPDFRFHLIDLAALPFDQLRDNIIANGLLAIMKAVDEKDPLTALDPVLEILALALNDKDDGGLLSRFLGYLFHYSPKLDTTVYRNKIMSLPNIPFAMKVKTLSLADQFIAEGRQDALASTLERQLTRRFGDLPQPVRTRLHSASIPELEDLTDAILDAPTLQDLFPES